MENSCPKSIRCSKHSFKRQVQFYLKKEEKSQISNLNLYLKDLEKEEQTKFKVSRRKRVIRIREEINEINTKKNRNDQ